MAWVCIVVQTAKGVSKGAEIGFVLGLFFDYVVDSKQLVGFVPLKNKPFFGSSFLTALFLRYPTSWLILA